MQYVIRGISEMSDSKYIGIFENLPLAVYEIPPTKNLQNTGLLLFPPWLKFWLL